MRNIWTIARREYKLYFISPVAYVVAFLFMAILGFFFYSAMGNAIQQALYQSYAPTVQVLVSPMVTLLLFTMPAITMRLLAEEARMGTLELMLTAPVKDWELVIGKWLGGFLFMLTLLVATWVFPIALNIIVEPGIDQGLMLTNYLGLVLMVASLVGLGVGISSLFSNQIAAFFVSLAVVLIFWIVRPAASGTGSLGVELLTYMNFVDHYMSFFQGIIDLSDVIYYVSLTAVGLFLGTVAIEIRRWR
jgi:ABC-2 type transport system permease protein